jgi:hypothetical protein
LRQLRHGKLSPSFKDESKQKKETWIKRFESWSSTLKQVFKTVPKLPVAITVFRGVDEAEAKLFQAHKKRDDYRTKAFLSTTYQARTAFNFASVSLSLQ